MSNLAIKIGSRPAVMVTDWENASLVWTTYRDINGLGASQSPQVTVKDTRTRRTVARVSYNGKVWPPGEWQPDMEPLYNPYGRTTTHG